MKKYTLKKSVFKDFPDGDYSGLAFTTGVFFATPFISSNMIMGNPNFVFRHLATLRGFLTSRK